MFAKIESAGRTDIGKKRESNQDQFFIAELQKSMCIQATSLNLDPQTKIHGNSLGSVLVVADGMGGHQGGRRASRLAIDLLINQLLNNMHWIFYADFEETEREERFIADLKTLLQRAHEAIENESRSQRDNRGMGTTLTMAYIIWPSMYVLHAGDSRCYLFRDGKLQQLTHDHTISNQLVQQGGMTVDEASKSPWSNVLYNALGAGGDAVTPELHKEALQAGDVIMLCSDGLYRHIEDKEVQDMLATELDPHEVCRSFIELANYRGGADNITVVVAKVSKPEALKAKTKVTTEITLERLRDESTQTFTSETSESLKPQSLDTLS